MNWDKAALAAICEEKCLTRIEEIKSAMEIAEDSIFNDTKSSMGDKYETSREMAQQELNRLQNQLIQAEIDLDRIKNLNLISSESVIVGSIIITDQFDYFISISVGPLKIDDKTIMVVSKESPIANVLLTKKVGDSIFFNGKTMTIKEIL